LKRLIIIVYFLYFSEFFRCGVLIPWQHRDAPIIKRVNFISITFDNPRYSCKLRNKINQGTIINHKPCLRKWGDFIREGLMTYGEFTKRVTTTVVIIGVAFILFRAVIDLASILLIVFTCWVLSVGLNHIIGKMTSRGMNRGLAALITLSGVGLVIALVLFIIIPPFIVQITNLVNDLPTTVEGLVQDYDNFRTQNPNLGRVLPQFTLDDYRELFNAQVAEITAGEPRTALNLDVRQLAGSALPILGGIGSFVGSLIANTIFIILITGYLLADPLVYYRPILTIIPKSQEQRMVEVLNKIRKAIVAWMGGLAISITFTGTLVTLMIGVVLNVPNALALGVLSGVAGIIPNVGYYIALVPVIIFTAADDPVKVIPAAIIYWLINQIEGALVTPAVVKNQLNIPAGVVLPFQLIAAAVFGFYGILLAVPILAILIIIVKEFYVYDTLGKGKTYNPQLVMLPDGEIRIEYDEDDLAENPHARAEA